MERRTPERKKNTPFLDLLTHWQGSEGRSSWAQQMLPSAQLAASRSGVKPSVVKSPMVSTGTADDPADPALPLLRRSVRPSELFSWAMAANQKERQRGTDGLIQSPVRDAAKRQDNLPGPDDAEARSTWQLPIHGKGDWTADLNAWRDLITTWFVQEWPCDSGSATTPSVSTDKADYAPGETASIAASGFRPGSRVQFRIDVVNDPGSDGLYGTSDDVVDKAATRQLERRRWQVKDGSRADLDPGMGKVATTWVVDPDARNTTLRLTATGFGADNRKGTADDQVAMATFKDAQGSFSKPYAHWSDEPLPGDWNNNILNDNKSNYFEGEVIPHVFTYGASNNAKLVNGQSYSFNVTYNWYEQNTDAGGFAYMTQYDLSRQPNVFNWATPAVTPLEDGAFTNGGGMAASTSFYTVDADIDNVSAVTYTGTGTKDGHVTITFTYTGTTTSSGYAAIYYGLYVAKPGEVPDQGKGKTNGANAWSGGSLQTTVDIGGSGATSLQLNPAAILTGEISGVKFNDLNGNGIRDTGEPGLADWTIVLDKDTTPNNGNEINVVTANGTTDDLDGNGNTDPLGFYYFSVTPGTYYVREVNQPGWAQTAPSNGYYGPLIISATTPTYINQDFGNQQTAAPGSVTIQKYVSVDGGKSWDDADAPTGPSMLAGVDASGNPLKPLFKFVVENGNPFAISGITLTDSVYNIGTVNVPDLAKSDDTEGSGDDTYTLIYNGATWQPGQHTNVATIVYPVGGGQTDTASDPANYFGADPSISIDKVTVDGNAVGDSLNILTGESISWKYTVTNNGNVALNALTVVDDNGTPRNTDDDITVGTIASLAPGQSTTLSLSGTSTSGNYKNIGRVNGTYTDSDGQKKAVSDSDSSSYFGAQPQIDIDKVTVYESQSGDGLTGVIAGKPITWKYTINNTGNVDLANVTVTDDNGTPLNTADDFTVGTIASLAKGTSAALTYTGTAITGNYSNIGKATGSYTDSAGHERSVTDTDTSSYIGNAYYGLIAPTGTTCDQYIQGTAYSYEDYYDGTPGANLNGDIQYADNSARPGTINSTNPGVFFYYTGLSGFIKGDSKGEFTLKIDQENKQIHGAESIRTFPLFASSEIKLYRINDVGTIPGKIDPSDTCAQVNLVLSGSRKNAELSVSEGDYTLKFIEAAKNAMYVVGVKYSTAAIQGTQFAGTPFTADNAPTFSYTYKTLFAEGLKASALGKTAEEGKINVSYKFDPNPDGDTLTTSKNIIAGGSAPIRNQPDSLIGASNKCAERQVRNKLRHADILSGDHGGPSSRKTDDITAYVGDHAAGHGCSISPDGVPTCLVNRFFPMIRRFSQIVGYDDLLMSSSLSDAERNQPFKADDVLKDQFQMATAGPSLF